MTTLRKRHLILGAAALAVLALAVFVEVRGARTYDAPLPELHASSDPALIERGRHLFHGPAYCIGCHGDQDALTRADAPPTGGFELRLLPGVFRAPNLTSHPVHGIAATSDAAFARMLRSGVRADGQLSVPIMQYQNLADSDVVAIMSYVRSLPPVEHPVATSELNFVGKALMAFGVLAPQPSRALAEPPSERDLEAYGRYLAVDVANCQGCHTQRDAATGAYTGPLLAGGLELQGNGAAPRTFVSPDITRAGFLRGVSREGFVARLRAGRAEPGSPMPWEALGRASDAELHAIYAYLVSVSSGPKQAAL